LDNRKRWQETYRKKKVLKYKIIEWNVIIEKNYDIPIYPKGKEFTFLEIVKKILIKAIK